MSTSKPTCDLHEHPEEGRPGRSDIDPGACQVAAGIFRALGDPARMQILALLLREEMCVTEIAATLQENLSAVSQRLKLLRSERVVRHRREGKHVFYALADEHIAKLVSNGLAHASEPEALLRGRRPE